MPAIFNTVLFLVCASIVGCGSSTDSQPTGAAGDSGARPAPFEGYWRKYDDPQKHFVEFSSGRVSIGDKDASQTGTFSYTSASEVEPLYQITASLPDVEQTFELYFEEDTVDLFFEDRLRSGLYEITFNAP